MNKRLSSYFAAGLMACLVGFSGNKAEAQEVFTNNHKDIYKMKTSSK